jgi:hypothetical protein
MSTDTRSAADLEQADADAVMQRFLHGTPLDPEVERRVEERANEITERLRATHGIIDDDTFQALLDSDEET